MRRSFLTVAGVVVCLGALALALHFALPDVERTSDLAGIIQASVAALAIAAGGVFAGYRLQVFRDYEPHLTVSQTVSHRSVGTSYLHVAVTATLHNGSRVSVEVRDGFFRLHQLAPVDDEDVEFIYEQAPASGNNPDFEWPLLGEVSLTPRYYNLVIEPGETHYEYCEFIVSRDVESVLAHSFFYNARYSESSRSAHGWTSITAYDTVENVEEKV